MNVLVYDIETVPDVEGAKRINGWESLTPPEVVEGLNLARRQKVGHEFQPLHLQKIVAISLVWRSDEHFKVWSLGTEASDEKELIQRFFDGLERFAPTLVSWNGSGFDLPVLHYRALRHMISAPRYWELGENQSSFRWNNYISRYHWRHTDLMDVLASHQNRAFVPLDQLSTLLGFPGKMGMSGASVWDAYQNGELKRIRDYCETDVLNTYLVYLRFLLFKGELTAEEVKTEEALVRTQLTKLDQPHLSEFLSAWSTPE